LGAAILLTFLVGIALDFINVPAQTIMQERAPDWIKGRVLAVQGMILNIATVIFVPLMGLVADHVSISSAMLILDAAIAVVGLGTVYYSSRLDMARTSPVGGHLPKQI
jgi:MFS family permease